MLYPIVFYTLFGFTSDWIVFRWYFYPLPVLFLVSTSVLARRFIPSLNWIRNGVYITTSIGIIFFGIWNFYRQTIRFVPEANSVFQHAALLQPFVASHPGLYAMGDRAGLTAFMCNMPVVQLEGLSSGLPMIDSIRKQTDLLALLHHHGVRYLIESRDSALSQNEGNFTIFTPQARRSWSTQPCDACLATGRNGQFFTLRHRKRVGGWIPRKTVLGEVNTYVFELH